MTTPGIETDLGWTLGAVLRGYLRAADAVLADVPGGPRGFQVLVAAGRNDPGSQLALAQQLGIDRTVMTYLIDDLEGAGLVERRPDPADRRARRIAITEAGETRLCELEFALRDVEEHVLEPLDPAERDVLRALLRRLAVRERGEIPDVGTACQEVDEIRAAAVAAPARRSRRR